MSQDTKVELYLYDLSGGMAAQMSLALTGNHIPAVWHSSIVVFDEEIYFGMGIQRCRPGFSHHGRPLRMVQLGTTALDRETFQEYLASLQEVYTSDKYHLLDFNCNTFTNDVSNFLTGNSIPQEVIDLPKEFLSTPFGASMRPYIDNLFRGQMQRAEASLPPQLAQAVQDNPALQNGLNQVVESAQRAIPGTTGTRAEPLSSGLTVATNLSSFNSLLASNKAVAVMFTGDWCGPCKVVKPVFEQLSHRSSSEPPVMFILVDTTAGREIAQKYAISAVPTFLFLHRGNKIAEVRGADAAELRAQVGILSMTAFPPHEHTKLRLPTLQSMSTAPILFEQKPNLEAATTKLDSFVVGDTSAQAGVLTVKRIATSLTASAKSSPEEIRALCTATRQLLGVLTPAQYFPLFDILRFAILDDRISTIIAETLDEGKNLIAEVVSRTTSSELGKSTLLTLLRLLCNSLSNAILAASLLTSAGSRDQITQLIVKALLEQDKPTRACGGSLAYSVTGWLRSQRKQWVEEDTSAQEGFTEQEELETELCSATIEALDREDTLEVAHRLLGALGNILYLSPHHQSSLLPLAEALEAKRIVQSKQDLVRSNVSASKLLEEASQLC